MHKLNSNQSQINCQSEYGTLQKFFYVNLNILSSKDALIFPDAFDKKTVDLLSSLYQLIEVIESEQFSKGDECIVYWS